MAKLDDTAFVEILDAALADATHRAGNWLACRAGCSFCCHGVFAISSLDAHRLNRGLVALRESDPERANRIATRCTQSRDRLALQFPGDAATGRLFEDDESKERFEDFANDEVCPVLDPESGACDLYASRPVTCRVFGPPVRSADGVGVCELCFQGAPEEEVTRCELHLPAPELEEELTREHGTWTTIIAYALRV